MTGEELLEKLIDFKIISAEDLKRGKNEAAKRRTPLLQTLFSLGIVEKEDVYEIEAEDMGTVYVDVSNYIADKSLKEVFPQEMAQNFKVLPLFKLKDTVVIASAEPTNVVLLDRLSYIFSATVEFVYSLAEDIERAINNFYGRGDSAEILIRSLEEAGRSGGAELAGEESPVTKLVDLIITQAVRDRASDIHIEPEEDFLRIRFRIDGVLHEIPSPPKNLELPLISRIKVLSGMDIAESRIPQDGHTQLEVDGKTIDLRVSTLPTITGENVVMRILDTSSVLIGLDKLGFSEEDEKKFEEIITRPYGIILTTGPTGSGKTTTLYSALTFINSLDRNIITVEDPVEYRLGLIRQVQINPKTGLTFANGLRSILRQDPDVIMVGEIRDLETAIIAVQAALTGHLVFSTLHTNDAPSAVVRLENMGVERFLVSASLIAVMAQRLVRVVCPECKEAYKPEAGLLRKLNIEDKNVKFYKGRGCDFCKGTGYRGRKGLFEIMTLDDELKEMIIGGASVIELREKARSKGMKTLKEDGVNKVLAGITSIEEVFRVTEERVEIKKPVRIEEVKPMTRALGEEPKPAKKEITSAPLGGSKDLIEDYQKKIASWLSKK